MSHNQQFLSSIPDALEDFAQGKMLIVVDDHDRENEGDFVMAADKITPEAVNFMAKYGRGLICTPISKDWAKRLDLPLLSQSNTSAYNTPFTISIDAKVNTTTGISAFDRYETIKKLAEPFAKADDFLRPGHIFPLIANDAGVLKRPGHTEAAIDLCNLAGSQPVGVICEIMNEDGSMARFDDLKSLASFFQIKMISIADLVRYRRLMENGIEVEESIPFPNKYGQDFDMKLLVDRYTGEEYTIITKNINESEKSLEPVLVRVHSQCFTGDLFGSKRCDCGEQLEKAMNDIEAAGKGALIYLNQEGRGIGLANKIRAYKLQDQGYDTISANHQLGFDSDLRDFTPAAMILRALGVSKVELMTNNLEKVETLMSYGIEVTKRLTLEPSITSENKKYLMTKKHQMGHQIHLNQYLQ